MQINMKQKNRTISNKFRISRLDLSGWMLLAPFLVLVVYLYIMPTFRGVLWSFFEMRGYNVGEFAGLENYRVVLQDTSFLTTLKNTLLYVFWSFVIGYLPPVIFAVMLNEIGTGNGFFKFTVYFPKMAPAIAVSMLWYYIYYPAESGLLNMVLNYFGAEPSKWLQNSNQTIALIQVSETWRCMGSVTLLYLSAIQGINRDLYEAALLDGAGFMRRIRHITLPHILPIMLINGVRQMIEVFQIMEQPLAMTDGGPNGASLSLGLSAYRYAFQFFKVGNALALNIIQFLMLIALTMVYFKVKEKVENDA